VSMIIQKFGGQSLVTAQQREQAASQVKRALDRGFTPVIVVSAMGRRGDSYATDTLLEVLQSVRANPDQRSADLMLSCGEIVAACVFAETLAASGLVAVALTASQCLIKTDGRYGGSRIQTVDTGRLMREIQAGKIPVVTGFQGVFDDGEISTLGRGGSDTTAAALGAALEAEWVEIFTDVDGVKTADPSIVPEAGTIDALTYQEVVELAHLGAKVIHPRAVELAMEKGMPLKVLSLEHNGGGTIIGGRGRLRVQGTAAIDERIVAGIAHIPGRAKIQIDDDEDFNASGMALQVFDSMAGQGISVDMIQLSPDRIGFIVAEADAETGRRVLSRLKLRARVDSGFAKVSVVGAGMHGVPGVMVRIVSCLRKIGVPILQTTDSHANISCLIAEEHLTAAVSALHHEFQL